MSQQGNGDGSDQGKKPPAGLHFLKALTHGAMAFGHLMFQPEPDEQTEDENEAGRPAPRRRRTRRFSSGGGARPAKPGGGCCTGRRR